MDVRVRAVCVTQWPVHARDTRLSGGGGTTRIDTLYTPHCFLGEWHDKKRSLVCGSNDVVNYMWMDWHRESLSDHKLMGRVINGAMHYHHPPQFSICGTAVDRGATLASCEVYF